MKRLLALAAAAGDRVNPVAVKEFRQAVQSKWVVVVFMLFLLINLAVVGGYLMLSPEAGVSPDGGRDIFQGLMAILLITCMAFVPAYTAIRLSLERNDANIDLFFVTTITPGAIVRGKYFTAMALTLLIFSACMPFMVFTYLLRGIDLPTIFLILAIGFICCAAANAMGVFAGAVSGSWFIRGIVDVGVLIGLVYLAAGTIAMSVGATSFGWRTIGGGPAELWAIFATWLLIEALGIGLLYVLSVAMLSPKPSNRMLVPRLYITGSWAATGVLALLWGLFVGDEYPVIGWMICCGAGLMFLMVASLGERDNWSARVRRTIPHGPLSRLGAFLFYTGSAGGVAWCVLMFAATLLASGVALVFIEGFSPHLHRDEFEVVSANLTIVFGYILCYCLTTAFFRLAVLKNVPTPALPVIAAFLAMAACLVPYLISFFLERNWSASSAWYLLGSPMVLAMDYEPAKDAAGPLVIAWLALCLLLSSPWAFGQWQRFKPYRLTAVDEPAQ
ncbi:MAG: hypothetical protein JW959_12515 [Pirellulales bacterium]|nr:hypothetical protein [Pirellulales bacterium]